MRVRIATLIAVCSLGGSTAVLAQDVLDAGFSPEPAPAASSLAASSELGQDAGVPSSGQGRYETIVTGSRVPRKDLTGPGPLVIYSHEEIAASGLATAGEFLQQLPWQGGGTNSKVNAGSDGTVQLSLRNLGARRTLVLVDGKRWVNGGLGVGVGGSFVAAPDASAIPAAAIDRIEVLKDGASAIYGSDAAGGVVNIITRRRVEGVEVEGYYGLTPHGDGVQAKVNAMAGVATERGGFWVSVEYLHQSAVLAADRSWSTTALTYDFRNGRVDPSGSSTIPAGVARVDPAKCPTQLCQLLNGAYPGAGLSPWIPDGNPNVGVPVVTDPTTGQQWRRYVDSGPVNDRYNYFPVNDLFVPSDRLTILASGEYRLGESARARLQAYGAYEKTTTQQAPEVWFTLPGVSVASSNPYNPFGVPITSVSKRMVAFGNRGFQPESFTIHVTGGFDGKIESTRTSWSVTGGYGRTMTTSLQFGSADNALITNAIGPAFQDSNGVWRCGVQGAPISGCTPANLFGVNSLTPDMVKSMGTYTGLAKGWSELALADVDLGQELFTLWADRPAGLAAGYEFRHENGGYQPDAIAIARRSLTYVGNAVSATANSHEGYLELVVPIVSKIFLLDDLEAQAALRGSHYSSYGTNWTYKFGARWRPIRPLTLRGTYSRVFRAPALDELYSAQRLTIETTTDPCARIPASNTALRAQCESGPGGAAAVNNGDTTTQFNSLVGGNPALQPERAWTATAGTVIEPLKGLSLTADYYLIQLEDTIVQTIGANILVGGCYPASTGSSASPNLAYCDQIKRDLTTGRIQNFVDTYQDAGSLRTSGIDMTARYLVSTSAGRFRPWLDANYLIKQDLVLPNGKVLRSAGNYDLGVNSTILGVTPRFRVNAGLDYGIGSLTAGVGLRFVSVFHECAPQGGSTAAGGGLCADQNKDPVTGQPYPMHWVPYYAAFDLNVGYSVTSSIGHTTFSIGVRNLFDAKPPPVYTSALTITDYSYDFVGRYIWGRILHKF